ncbi:hypothetical protein DdX_13782 [Ditylenchus destructor]|uniref:Uncharacterized protein n=1 Tax=Ditylenchus destructor TaxID=166010 RepID=A0AAD4MTV4_9BILA|nr:hypothetical protein DdX_13782 [Ditylenchus destructor]
MSPRVSNDIKIHARYYQIISYVLLIVFFELLLASIASAGIHSRDKFVPAKFFMEPVANISEIDHKPEPYFENKTNSVEKFMTLVQSLNAEIKGEWEKVGKNVSQLTLRVTVLETKDSLTHNANSALIATAALYRVMFFAFILLLIFSVYCILSKCGDEETDIIENESALDECNSRPQDNSLLDFA